MAVQIGDKVPEFLGTDQDGKEVKMSDYKGKKVALYFYPKDNTSGCTAEACSLRDGYQALQAKGFEIIGVSKIAPNRIKALYKSKTYLSV